jgi:hypothetical protein
MTTTLDKYVEYRKNVQATVDNYRLVPLELSNIQKRGNTFSANGNQLGDLSLKNLLGVLGVKEELVNEIKDDASQWEPLHDALSNIKENKVVTAVVDRNNSFVTRIFSTPVKEETVIDLTNGLRWTEEFLKKEEASDLELRSFCFDPSNISINIDFKNSNSDIDVFGDGKDMWKGGFGMSFGLNKFQSYPFYLRLICSNGMQAVHRMSQRFVQSTDLTQKTFEKQIVRFLGNEEHREEVVKNCDRLRTSNASLREFYTARNAIQNFDKDLALSVCNDIDIKKSYEAIGINVNKQNGRWLSTANSNVNSYDLFNTLTHVATHNVTDADIATRMELNRLASDLFFKGPDFALIAPNPFEHAVA